ncbi:hypothetical protein EDC19_0866 [Natranaerovirga hydrolytica]|uniref:Uncharacterized protein n=1 Tax=Natranaerovirga hydrolytica TaxID=680378 RepID=A0A4R1N343_9FIRM|nr:hypothetical protein EDC19_0866 [Natranaerovirga hydrolytica]
MKKKVSFYLFSLILLILYALISEYLAHIIYHNIIAFSIYVQGFFVLSGMLIGILPNLFNKHYKLYFKFNYYKFFIICVPTFLYVLSSVLYYVEGTYHFISKILIPRSPISSTNTIISLALGYALVTSVYDVKSKNRDQ